MKEFENLFKESQNEIEARKTAFMEAIESKLSIEEIHKDFSNLKKLENIEQLLAKLISNPVDLDSVKAEIRTLKTELEKIKSSIEDVKKNDNARGEGKSFSFWGRK